MFQKKILFFFLLYINILSAQKNYVDFFLENYSPKEGDFIFQDLDSSPLCDAIEEVTPGIFNQKFSHVGMIIKHNNSYQVIEAFSRGVKIVNLKDFLIRSVDLYGVPKITIAKIHPIFQKKNPNLIPEAIKKAKNLLNSPYDEKFLLNNDSFYCSELLYEAFNLEKEFFELAPMTYKNSNGEFLQIWIDYFKSLNMKIPERKLGINPGKMTLNKNLKFVYNYKEPFKFN